MPRCTVGETFDVRAVSYTHLDVYKRQHTHTVKENIYGLTEVSYARYK